MERANLFDREASVMQPLTMASLFLVVGTISTILASICTNEVTYLFSLFIFASLEPCFFIEAGK
jgi:hypothetical protein